MVTMTLKMAVVMTMMKVAMTMTMVKMTVVMTMMKMAMTMTMVKITVAKKTMVSKVLVVKGSLRRLLVGKILMTVLLFLLPYLFLTYEVRTIAWSLRFIALAFMHKLGKMMGMKVVNL